jgi:hypothetical protein
MPQTITQEKEYITHEANNPDAWRCICGNEPQEDGFSTCDAEGVEIEPLKDGPWSGLYICRRCGRIISQATLEVIAWNPHAL